MVNEGFFVDLTLEREILSVFLGDFRNNAFILFLREQRGAYLRQIGIIDVAHLGVSNVTG